MSARCSRHVLVVEDDRDIREVIAMVLTDEGYRVRTAADGAQALALLHGTPPPCVVLLDLMMPGMNGWDLAEALRAEDGLADIPLVVTSASEPAPDGAACVLPKPLHLHALLEAVRSLCGHGPPSFASV